MLPVLGSVLLEETAVGLRLRGTNFDLEVALVLPYHDGEQEREVEAKTAVHLCVPAKRLAGMLGAMEEDLVDLSMDHSAGYAQLGLKCGYAFAKLIGLEAEEFPPEYVVDPLAPDGRMPAFPMESGELLRLLALAVKYVSTDETRYVINGVRLAMAAGQVEAVATDGRRLIRVVEKEEKDDKGKPVKAFRVAAPDGLLGILPAKAVGVLLGLLRGVEPVTVAAGKIMVELTAGAWVVRARWIEGNYPNWQQVVPRPEHWLEGVDSVKLAGMVERAGVVAKVSNTSVRLVLHKTGEMDVSAREAVVGDYRESAVLARKGPPKELTLSLNPEYLLGALLPGDDMEWGVTDAASPLLVRSVKQGLTAVVMPMWVEPGTAEGSGEIGTEGHEGQEEGGEG